jgi:hypothetical protein
MAMVGAIAFTTKFIVRRLSTCPRTHSLPETTLCKNAVNIFIEMHGMHRFKDDVEWGQILFRMRAGTLTDSDRATINAREVVSEEDKAALLDREIQYATHLNFDRNAINAGLFLAHLAKHHSTNAKDSVPPFFPGNQVGHCL